MEVRGLGQLLAALAAAFFVRAIRGPGPALLPPADDTEDDETDTEAGEGGGGGVPPVTIRWARITCALKNKRGEVVSSLHRRHGTTSPPSRRSRAHETLALPICPSVVLSFRLPRVLVCVDSLTPVFYNKLHNLYYHYTIVQISGGNWSGLIDVYGMLSTNCQLPGKVSAVKCVRGGETREAVSTHGTIGLWQNNSAQCASRAAHGIVFPAPFRVSVCQRSAYLEGRI